MAQTNDPSQGQPGPVTVHVHHPQGTGHTPGHAIPGSAADDQIDPNALKIPQVSDYLRGKLGGPLVVDGGRVRLAPPNQPAPLPVLTREQVVDQVLAGVREGLLTKPETLEPSLQELADLCFLQNQIVWELVRQNLPFNYAQVRAGGYALLLASLDGGDDAKSLKTDVVSLGMDLALVERVRRQRTVFDPISEALEANETVALNRIASAVDQALERGWSVIQKNAELRRKLGPALAIRGKPAADALTSRTAGERRDEGVRQQTQTEMAGTEKEVAPQATVTTVTTQAQSPLAGQAQQAGKPPRGGKKQGP